MSREQRIIREIKVDPIGKVKIAVVDIDGILRGKVVHRDKFLSSVTNGFGFCNVVFGWDAADVCYDNVRYTGWHTGYPDETARVDLDTFRRVPWDNNIPFFLADFCDASGKPLAICPRQLLKAIREESRALGLEPFFSQEFEWFNFRETAEQWNRKGYQNPTPITPGMFGYSLLRANTHRTFFNELFDLLGRFGVPVEGLHTETGPGVYEAAIQYADLLEAADRAVLFKAGCKEIAQQHQIMPSFMAKWHEGYPGCSGHLHQSLWDIDQKRNLFFDAAQLNQMSELMRSYLAGQLTCLPELLPMVAPTINSYKRLVEGAWAPTTVTWGIENRTCALRAIPGSEKSIRLETRIPGADVNPYLAMAAALASGLYGVKRKLKLEQPHTVGSGYADKSHGVLPRTLAEATAVMKRSAIAKEVLGTDFVAHFVETREWECRQYQKAVTDWELKRYFEII